LFRDDPTVLQDALTYLEKRGRIHP
jgi:hypothetical protein